MYLVLQLFVKLNSAKQNRTIVRIIIKNPSTNKKTVKIINKLNLNLKFIFDINLTNLVGFGYAPTTPAMSMQYSTIELTALF